MAFPSLSRTVRMQVPSRPEHLVEGPNTYAGSPLTEGIGAFFEVEVCCVGPLDAVSGYVEEIHSIDQAVREAGAPLLSASLASQTIVHPSALARTLLLLVDSILASTVESLSLKLNPYHDVTIDRNDMNHATLTRRYTFSASHWLRNQDLDDAGNLAVFGKCSGPNGHGHNYELEVRIRVPATGDSTSMSIVELDHIVQDHVLTLLDHKHLNLDVAAFKDMNPTLENITATCHQMLRSHLDTTTGKLVGVKVWETDRTFCEYPAPGSSEAVAK